jgi:hypothetical protein
VTTDSRSESQPSDDPFVTRLTAHLDRRAAGGDADDPDADPRFAAVNRALAAPGTWSEPPPGARDALLARVRTQAAIVVPADAVPGRATGPPVADSTPRPSAEPEPPAGAETLAPVHPLVPRWRRLAWAVPVTATAAAVLAFGVVTVDRALRPGVDPGRTYVATSGPYATQASAEVTVAPSAAGFIITVDTENLPAAAPGSYYSGWLSGPRGLVPLGSFHGRQVGQPITLWSGVDPRDYPRFSVTLQAEGAGPNPSGKRVLVADLTG